MEFPVDSFELICKQMDHHSFANFLETSREIERMVLTSPSIMKNRLITLGYDEYFSKTTQEFIELETAFKKISLEWNKIEEAEAIEFLNIYGSKLSHVYSTEFDDILTIMKLCNRAEKFCCEGYGFIVPHTNISIELRNLTQLTLSINYIGALEHIECNKLERLMIIVDRDNNHSSIAPKNAPAFVDNFLSNQPQLTSLEVQSYGNTLYDGIVDLCTLRRMNENLEVKIEDFMHIKSGFFSQVHENNNTSLILGICESLRSIINFVKTKRLKIYQFDVKENELLVYDTNKSVKELKIYDVLCSNPRAFKNFIGAFKTLENFTLKWSIFYDTQISIEILKKLQLTNNNNQKVNIVLKKRNSTQRDIEAVSDFVKRNRTFIKKLFIPRKTVKALKIILKESADGKLAEYRREPSFKALRLVE